MKIAMEEVLDIQSELNKELKNISTKLQAVRNETRHIGQMKSFQGKTATASKNYFQTVHEESIDDLNMTIGQLLKNYKKITSEFKNLVDISSSAIITDDYLHDHNDRVRKLESGVLETNEDGHQIIQSVSDIVSLTKPNISPFSQSVNLSQKYIDQLNQKLIKFEETALTIVQDSMNEVENQKKKLTKFTAASIKSGLPNNFIKMADELGIDISDESAIAKWANFMKAIKSGSGSVVSFFDKSNQITEAVSKAYVLYKMTPKEYLKYAKTGKSKLTSAQLREFGNILGRNPYQINLKTVKSHLSKYGMRIFTKERMKGLLNHLKPYGNSRRKGFLQSEFDKYWGLDKYRDFKKLTPMKKAGKLGTTFVDELVGKKYKGTKKAFSTIVSWTNPSKAYENQSKKSKKPKSVVDKKNVIGKGSKITKNIGKGFGALSFGLIVADNYQSNKGDTKKIVVGTAVDGALTGGAAAIGATVGSAIVPPIGTVVGAGVGVLVSAGLNTEFGTPPKSIADHSKDLVNKGVDSAIKSTKKIGNAIAGWFK